MGDLVLVTFWGEEVVLSAARQEHIVTHGPPEMLTDNAQPIADTLQKPELVLLSAQAPGFQLFFAWGQNPTRPNHYSKVIVNYKKAPAIVVTAMTSDGPRTSELLGEVRYDARS